METYRHLTPEEISVMEQADCMAVDWNDVMVKSPFEPHHYRLARFSGRVRLGTTGQLSQSRFGATPSGIYNAHIHNCTIGDNVRIVSVHDCIADYDIGDDVLLCNVDSMTCSGDTSFGNGVMVNVLDETGARATPIFENLSAQIAYIYAFYRHDQELIGRLKDIIDRYVSGRHSRRGFVGKGAVICDTASISDVAICADACIHNAGSLTNGTICQKTIVRNGVIARDFIFQTDSVVENSALLDHVFVGQGAHVADGFSATHSLIFANCELLKGEAVSLFAGPHTVSRHKSTLLIGGYFSFFDAGSATNESNSHYRLGHIHYGIAQRGCKSGAGTCIMWPARFGQHSIVTGNHFKHPDTALFSFSYVNSDARGRTIVRPARVLSNAGLISDLCGWPESDRRCAYFPRLDCVNYDMFSPYYIGSLFTGLNELVGYENNRDAYSALNITIPDDDMAEGRKIYAFFIDYLVGQKIIMRFLDTDIDVSRPLGPQLFPVDINRDDAVRWIDVAGLIAPRKCLYDRVVNPVKTGEIADVDDLCRALWGLHADYAIYQSCFLRARFVDCFMVEPDLLEPQMFRAIIDRWSESLAFLTSNRMRDCLKEFSGDFRIVYGIDGDTEADFRAVRGTPDTNPVVRSINEHYLSKHAQYVAAVEKFNRLYSDL